MKERARELKGKGDGESAVLEKITEMKGSDRAMAKRLHAIVKEAAPELSPRTWYGMPAYAKDGKVLCYFQSAAKFKARYATFGFSDEANLDKGAMWPTSFSRSTGSGRARASASTASRCLRERRAHTSTRSVCCARRQVPRISPST